MGVISDIWVSRINHPSTIGQEFVSIGSLPKKNRERPTGSGTGHRQPPGIPIKEISGNHHIPGILITIQGEHMVMTIDHRIVRACFAPLL